MSVILPTTWDNIAGETMNNLADNWWIRAYEFSSENNPFLFEDITNPRGRLGSVENALQNQPEPIFYLGGTFVADEDVTGGDAVTFTPERSIVVPEGAILVFPLINALAPDPVLAPPVTPDVEDARNTVNFFFDIPSTFTATVTVDGVEETVINESSPAGSGLDETANSYRRQSIEGFTYTIPEDNLFDDESNDYPAQTVEGAISDGYWYAFDTSDLGTGSHTIEFNASIDIDGDGSSDFTLEVTYNILNEIIGTDKQDDILGTEFNDYISGGNDRDILNGLEGDDLILGGNKRDQIDGGVGNDELWGGNDRDTFIYGCGQDTIFDFTRGESVVLEGFSESQEIEIIDEPLLSGIDATQVKFNDNDILTFVNVAPSELSIDLGEGIIIGI